MISHPSHSISIRGSVDELHLRVSSALHVLALQTKGRRESGKGHALACDLHNRVSRWRRQYFC